VQPVLCCVLLLPRPLPLLLPPAASRLRASFHPSQPSSSTSSSAAYYTPSRLSTRIGVILLPGQVPCTPDCHLSGAVYESQPDPVCLCHPTPQSALIVAVAILSLSCLVYSAVYLALYSLLQSCTDPPLPAPPPVGCCPVFTRSH
jgi:hypothetical protein